MSKIRGEGENGSGVLFGKRNFAYLYNKQFGDLKQVNDRVNGQIMPDEVFHLAIKYFQFCEDNPIQVAESASFQGYISEHPVHKTRVFTQKGLCSFLCMSEANYKLLRHKEGYEDVIAYIDNVIYEQKYQLAVNNVINAGMIGKEIGIDKPQEITVNTNNNIDTEAVKKAVSSVMDKL